jgi:hypothetical protein
MNYTDSFPNLTEVPLFVSRRLGPRKETGHPGFYAEYPLTQHLGPECPRPTTGGIIRTLGRVGQKTERFRMPQLEVFQEVAIGIPLDSRFFSE